MIFGWEGSVAPTPLDESLKHDLIAACCSRFKTLILLREEHFI